MVACWSNVRTTKFTLRSISLNSTSGRSFLRSETGEVFGSGQSTPEISAHGLTNRRLG